MIQRLENLPSSVAAFRATGEVTADDFREVVMPRVNRVVEKTGKLDYLMVIDTPLKNFDAGAWLEDLFLGIKKITKWNKVAILSDSEGIQKFTNIFSLISPGEFKGFNKNEIDKAVTWITGTEYHSEASQANTTAA